MFFKIVKQKIFIHSFIIAFLISFTTIFLVFPEIRKLFYTDITGGPISLSIGFIIKVFGALLGETSALGGIFYMLAKKIF